ASQPGVGTSVRLYLPRLVAPLPVQQTPPAKAEALPAKKAASRAILVVDDEHAVLDVVRRFLEIAGHRVTCVLTGADAFDVLEKGQVFDLVILDLMIPFENGSATIERLRRQWPSLPILLCTGMLQADSTAPSLQGDNVRLLRKPFRMEQLWQEVELALR
ncbi:MAG TPA: response regulator, partial [Gemmataceae bacterium]|nr:response regulator [Gemmataceae bacterium]